MDVGFAPSRRSTGKWNLRQGVAFIGQQDSHVLRGRDGKNVGLGDFQRARFQAAGPAGEDGQVFSVELGAVDDGVAIRSKAGKVDGPAPEGQLLECVRLRVTEVLAQPNSTDKGNDRG